MHYVAASLPKAKWVYIRKLFVYTYTQIYQISNFHKAIFSDSAFCPRHFCVPRVKTLQQLLSTVSKTNTFSPLFKHFRINLIPLVCNKPLIFDKKSLGTIKESPHLCVN